MNRPFSANLVRPNLPLRKPSSSPMARSSAAPRHPLSAAEPGRPASQGDGPLNSPTSGPAVVLGSTPPALTVYFCNFCGQQGNFRCKRCKQTPYCSVVCQTEDWKAHRHMCKAIELQPAEEQSKEASPVIVDKTGLVDSKHDDAPVHQKVYLKDLHKSKAIKGADIQASVEEFYSPGRFFLRAQSKEQLEALQSISAELQKTYSFPSVTTHVPCVGEVCAIQFSCDMNWYRGLVQTWAAHQKTAHVLYIDFGNEEDVPVDRIRPQPANIPPFCPCAMECRIAGVVPVAGNWSRECCIALRQMLAGKNVTARVVETPENGHVHVVDILLSMGKQLSTFLLEHGYAEKETLNVPVPTEQEIDAMVSVSLENFRCRSDGKDDNAWAQPPEPLTQAVGDSFTVVVTHLQAPDNIVVQKVENAGVIQELQLQLREHCSHVSAAQNFRPAPGTVCCAQFSEDKQWYRAKVLAYSSEECVCLGYIDFGNSEEVDLGHLRPISTSLLALPMQAMPCGLAGVQPVGGSWSEDCLLALQRRVSNRILRVEIQGAHEAKALVAMIDEASDPQGNIAELLISAGYAAPAAVNTGSDQQADKTSAAEPQVSGLVCEPLSWSYSELPSRGQTVALLASVVENPGEFFCLIDNPTDHQRLIELGNELKQHCEADASPFEPKVGEPCCAMFPGDGAWYRVMVKGQDEDKVAVNFVDYGYSMNVEKRQLRSITPQLLKLPFQAIRCWLPGVEPLGSEWSSEALLWFQTLVDGAQLSACVCTVTEQGYGVELESRGQNVAAALISEQLAKAPGEMPKEMHTSTQQAPEAKPEKSIVEKERSQIQVQASNQTGSTKETKAAPTAPSFPEDWKTEELPVNKTFKPCIAAVTSPSLFYLLSPSQVDQQKLQEVMVELAAYCSNNQATLSSSTFPSKLVPGAACCAQFSADKNWYRAVVLETGENEMSVLYADYGNTEKVPYSQILPIPVHLLQFPFQITRCTLTGKEHFPAEWSKEMQQMFKSLLINDLFATVQSFDGFANIVSLTLPTERGGGHLSVMLLDALQAEYKRNPCPGNTVKTDQTDSGTPTTSPATAAAAAAAAAADCSITSIHEPQGALESTNAPTGPNTTSKMTPQKPPQTKNTCAESANDSVQKILQQMEPPCTSNTKTNDRQTSGCCCLSLKAKIDHLEQLMQLQLSLVKSLMAQTK